jgi:hypothetical protein
MQQCTVYVLYSTVNLLYIFRVPFTPIIRSTGHCSRRQFLQVIWLAPYQWSTTTVSCTPDDRCKWHPKTCRVNLQWNKEYILCIVAYRWIMICIIKMHGTMNIKFNFLDSYCFYKSPQYQFHWNPPSGSRADVRRQTDGQDEDNGRLSELRERP